MANKPSLIVGRPGGALGGGRGSEGARFLIVDSPTDANLDAYLREFAAANVRELVRACDCAYSADRVRAAGVAVHDLAFPDGEPPPDDVIARWLALCSRTFAKGNPGRAAIAVHCVAGLGRAPVLVAIALIEDGMEPLDAVHEIRAKRKGAINARQLAYLENTYKRRAAGCTIA